MVLAVPSYSQYFTFDYRYRFKICGERVTLKIFNAFQKRVFKLQCDSIKQAPADPFAVVQELFKKNLIPVKYRTLPFSETPTQEHCIKILRELAIEFEKSEEGKEAWDVVDQPGAADHECLISPEISEQLSQAVLNIENNQMDAAIGDLSSISYVDYRIASVLIRIYILTNQEKEVPLFITKAVEEFKEQPDQTIFLYKQALTYMPMHYWMFYTDLAELLKTSSEKAHILMQGALAALKVGKYANAREFCEAAHRINDSFLDREIYVKIITTEYPRKSTLDAWRTLQEGHPLTTVSISSIQVWKMLIRLEYSSHVCEKIIEGYLQLGVSHHALKWLQIWKSHPNTPLSSELLKKVPENASEELWDCLGQIYSDSKQWGSARETYKKAFEKHRNFKIAAKLASICDRLKDVSNSVLYFYQAADLALHDIPRLEIYIKKIHEIDPRMKQLDVAQKQRMAIHTQRVDLYKELQAMKKMVTRSQKLKLFPNILSAMEWFKFSREIVTESSLPGNIQDCLEKKCPFFEGTIGTTQKLVFVPGGLTFGNLVALAKSQRIEVRIDQETTAALPTEPIAEGYWALMTPKTIPGSIACNRENHLKMLAAGSAEIGLDYHFFTTLEVLYLSILGNFINRENNFYGQAPVDYTRCEEMVGDKPVFVGNYGNNRIHVTTANVLLGTGAVHRFKPS